MSIFGYYGPIRCHRSTPKYHKIVIYKKVDENILRYCILWIIKNSIFRWVLKLKIQIIFALGQATGFVLMQHPNIPKYEMCVMHVRVRLLAYKKYFIVIVIIFVCLFTRRVFNKNEKYGNFHQHLPLGERLERRKIIIQRYVI